MPVCKKYEIFSGTTIYNYTDCLEIVQSNGGRRALQTTCAEHFQGEDLSTMKIWSAAKVIFLKKCPYFPQSFVKEAEHLRSQWDIVYLVFRALKVILLHKKTLKLINPWF